MLVPCDRCKRHISVREDVCPFCRQPGALSKLGAAALSAGVLLAGCDAGKTKTQGPGSAAVVPKRTYATVRGKVSNRAGGPLANASVTINLDYSGSAAQHGHAFGKTVPTDSEGRYTLDLIEQGAYILYFGFGNGSERGEDQRALVVKADEDQTIDVVLDMRTMDIAKPYGAPPARRRVV